MSNLFLSIIWAFLYAACAILGFIPSPSGAISGLLISASILFFLPPTVLLLRAAKQKNQKLIKQIRNVSLIWLVTALVLIVLNILSVMSSELTGIVLYYMLIIIASPMVCGQYWIISLFLWACLLMASWQQLRKMK